MLGDPSPASRPLAGLTDSELRTTLARAFEQQDGRLGAHCIHERWMRGASGVEIEPALERLWEQAAPTIPEWLPMRYFDALALLYQVASKFQARARGRSNLYLVLLDYHDRRGDPYGIYVGMSAYSPAQRFDQHKAGIRAAGSVLRRGLEIVPGPVLHLQYIARVEAARIEVELAEALRAAGLHVEGGH